MKRLAPAMTFSEFPLADTEQKLVESIRYITAAFILGICDPHQFDPQRKEVADIYSALDAYLPEATTALLSEKFVDTLTSKLNLPVLENELGEFGKNKPCIHQHFRMMCGSIQMAYRQQREDLKGVPVAA